MNDKTCELSADRFSTCPRCGSCVEIIDFEKSVQRLCTSLSCDYWHITLKTTETEWKA